MSADDPEDYKRKRESNNQSVKACREKQKKKIDEAKNEVDGFKIENENLKEKYESLQKELNLYKSLITHRLEPSSVPTAIASNQIQKSDLGNLLSMASTAENSEKKRQKLSQAEYSPVQTEHRATALPALADEPIVLSSDLSIIDDFINENTNSILDDFIEQQQPQLSSQSSFNIVPEDSVSNILIISNSNNNTEFSFNIIPTGEEATFFINDENNYQVNKTDGIITTTTTTTTTSSNKNQNKLSENIIINSSERKKTTPESTHKQQQQEPITMTTVSKYQRKRTTPMPFHHEYAFIPKTSNRKQE